MDDTGTAGRAPAVVIGEVLVDLIANADGTLTPVLGGGPFNTARTLGRLGAPCVFLTRLSEDAYGRALSEALASDGVHRPPHLSTALPTSLAMAELDRDGKASYRFYFEGTSAGSLRPNQALESLDALEDGRHAPRALHVGGLGLVLQPIADALEASVSKLAGRALVMTDPNFRKPLADHGEDYAARLDRILAQSDVVKVSDDDLRMMVPDAPPERAAAAFLERGPGLVLLTLGDRGAIALGAFGRRAIEAPRVAMSDTIGAGDVFSGAWLARWLEGDGDLADAEAVVDATRFACRAAAFSCARRGASPPRREDLMDSPSGPTSRLAP